MYKFWLMSAFFFSFFSYTLQLQHINIGAIFYDEESDLESYFKEIVLRFNNEYKLKYKLLPLVKRLSPFADTIELKNEACDLIENDVHVIFGPSSKIDNNVVSAICNQTGIPHLLFDKFNDEDEVAIYDFKMTLNMYPSELILSRAYADIISNYGWKKFTIVYEFENVKSILKLQDLLELYNLHNDLVRIRKFKNGDDYRILWKDIHGERRIILDCSPDIVKDILKASIPFDITGPLNQIFLTNLDTFKINFEELQNNLTFAVNITAVRLPINTAKNEYYYPNYQDLVASSLKGHLLYDAVSLFVMALNNISETYPLRKHSAKCIDYTYKRSSNSDVGLDLYKIMKELANSERYTFRTGNARLNDKGQRNDFNLEIYDVLNNYTAATWNTKGQIIPQEIHTRTPKKRKFYTVATRIGEPYFMENPEAVAKNITGNDRYMGYAVDLIEAISKEVGFEYAFVPVKDNAYGKYNKETKQWNGIIGELINNDAHMGICDLTITQARKSVVDFTVPFMQLGISILAYQKPHELKTWNAFLDPFTVDVWIYVMISIFFIALLFIVMARISNSEWENPHPCSRDPDILENKWNISNSFWLTIGSIMTAGSDILPRSAPMRTFSAMWWIFAVIISNSYTANLAAFLTNSKMEGSITGIKDLAEQSKIKFGTMEGGSTYTFFSETNETVYRLAYNMMQNDDPSAYTKDNKEGVERVLKNNGSYMFLMETTSIEYNTERNCKLKMLGEKFGEKHYAIAVPFGAEYRTNLSVAILKLSERGELFQLKNKWWKNHENVCHSDNQIEASEAPDMTFSEVRGIFYTLGVGVLIAYIIGITEFLIYAHKKAVKEKLLFKQVLMAEIKFVFCFWVNKKSIK